MADRTVKIQQADGAWLDAPWEALRAGMVFQLFEADGSPVNGPAHGGWLIALSDASEGLDPVETIPWSPGLAMQAEAWAKLPGQFLHPTEREHWEALIERVTLFFLRQQTLGGRWSDWPAKTINGWIAQLVTEEHPSPETEALLVELLAERAREVPLAMARRASLISRVLKRGERVLGDRVQESG